MSKGNPNLVCRLDRGTFHRLRSYAADTGRTMADIVRDALDRYLADVGSPDYTPAPADGQMGIDDMPPE